MTSRSIPQLASRTVIAALCVAILACKKEETLAPQPEPRVPVTHGAFPEGGAFMKVMIDEGSSGGAQSYYDTLASPSGENLELPGAAEPFTMDNLLAYCGYQGLLARDMQRLPSATLMDFAALSQQVSNPAEFTQHFGNAPITSGDILATRFFAPKITDVSGIDGTPRYGWRKIVRLKTRTSSPARTKNISDLYLLFNIFEVPNTQKDPFHSDNVSANNQAILLRATTPPKLYFMVFGEVSNTSPGQRIDFLNATFDARDPSVVEGGLDPVRRYYVPDACLQCHGGARPKLSFLDSDHWFDRVQAGDDFHALYQLPWGAVYDGGKIAADGGASASTPAFEDAFSVIRRLNTEIAKQNTDAGPAVNNLHLQGVNNWLRIHQNSSQHVSPIQRAFPTTPAWTPGDTEDEALLPLLNRFCYRCHSTVIYNVFDKKAVKNRRDFIKDLLQEPDLNRRMPQDRNLGPNDLASLLAALDAMN